MTEPEYDYEDMAEAHHRQYERERELDRRFVEKVREIIRQWEPCIRNPGILTFKDLMRRISKAHRSVYGKPIGGE